jgi:hypothetical protein
VKQLDGSCPIDGGLGTSTERVASGQSEAGAQTLPPRVEVLANHARSRILDSVPGELEHSRLDASDEVGMLEHDRSEGARPLDGLSWPEGRCVHAVPG